MTLLFELMLLAGSLTVAVIASRRAIDEASALAVALGAPPFIIGLAIVAVGTDLPEIANSIASHLQGQGDINVGDSIGSVLTQYTLVLALIALIGGTTPINRREVIIVGSLTMPGLVLSGILVSDGWLSRLDGALLVSAWAALLMLAFRLLPTQPISEPVHGERSHLTRISIIVVTLVLVGVAASLAVRSLVNVAEAAGVSEFVIAYFGAALATSAPEIVVVATAVRRREFQLALGDVLGASFVDATLSIGSGPLVAAAAVTASSAVAGIAYALAVTAIATVLLVVRNRHDRRSALVLLALYALAYVVVIR